MQYYYQPVAAGVPAGRILQANDGSGNLRMQVYHGTQYIDEVVGMRLPYGRAYVHQDANWNVTALTDLKGAVLERYYYSPYGQVEVAAETYFGDYDADGSVDSDDADDLCTSGCTCEFTSSVSGDCRVFDFDCDGDLDETDQNTLRTLYQGLSTDMQNRRIPSTTSSPTGNPFGHQGLVFDVEIGSYQNRARQYNPKLKRFMQRDPLALRPRAKAGYQDGMNLYEYVRSCPSVSRDPTGREADIEGAFVEIYIKSLLVTPCGKITVNSVSDCFNNLQTTCGSPTKEFVEEEACDWLEDELPSCPQPICQDCPLCNECANHLSVGGSNWVTVILDLNFLICKVTGSISFKLDATGFTGSCKRNILSPRLCD